jgi:cysteine desulfurase
MRDGIRLPSFLHGGRQERGMRAGTENVAAIVGMGEAAELVYASMQERTKKETELRDYMIHRIETEIPYCRLNGSRKNRLPGNVNVSFQFVEGETIVILLDMEGICCSSGSACMAGQSGASHVLQSISLPEDVAKGSLRFSLGEETTKEEIDITVDTLKEVLAKSRQMNPVYTSFLKYNVN